MATAGREMRPAMRSEAHVPHCIKHLCPGVDAFTAAALDSKQRLAEAVRTTYSTSICSCTLYSPRYPHARRQRCQTHQSSMLHKRCNHERIPCKQLGKLLCTALRCEQLIAGNAAQSSPLHASPCWPLHPHPPRPSRPSCPPPQLLFQIPAGLRRHGSIVPGPARTAAAGGSGAPPQTRSRKACAARQPAPRQPRKTARGTHRPQ